MIEIVYDSGLKNVFSIYSETETHIVWEDYARNLIRLNKHSGKISLLHDNEWIPYDLKITSYTRL